MPPRARSYDPARTRAALLTQARTVADAVSALPPEAYALPTRPGGRTVRDLVAHLAGTLKACTQAADGPPPRALTAADPAVARLAELTVHADDLAVATGTAVPLDRQALAATVRVLADALAEKAPGNAVEVRVPPFVAVQCVAGPRHTRGTPPNVVETDPVTWLRLATGRVAWATALDDAAVSASGERADLAAYLPVLDPCP